MISNNSPHIVLACASGQLGGTELRMLEEGRALKSMGYRVTVATPAFADGSRFQTLLEASGIPHAEFEPPKILNDWRWRHIEHVRAQFTDRSLLHSADLVHIFMPWTNQGYDQLWQVYKSGTPAVLSVHNAFTINEPISGWHQWHLTRAFSCVKGVYGVSRGALNNFNDLFRSLVPAETRQEVIYNFVDMDRFQPSAANRILTREKLQLPLDAPVFGSVGRLDKQKRPLSLLETFKQIHVQIPSARFILIGRGHLGQEVTQAVQALELEEAVTILPFQEDVENYFRAMDVHLLLSRNEGFGIVTAEAMACGIPVVGTKVPGTEEVIGDCPAGRLVPLGDQLQAAQAAMELYAQRVSLARSAREHVNKRFSRNAWQRQISEFYSAMLEGSSSKLTADLLTGRR